MGHRPALQLQAGVPTDHPALIKAAQWLLIWCAANDTGPSNHPTWNRAAGLSEFINDYPDGMTPVVIMSIKDIKVRDRKHKEQAIKRGISWCLGMQSENGGWGAFDKDNTKHILNKIPFADLEALIDPPTAGSDRSHAELMGNFNYPISHPIAARALNFSNRSRSRKALSDAGASISHGTWSVLCGLRPSAKT